jgi:dipeptidyl aminopeptidase/acylaminoacyl peptidase
VSQVWRLDGPERFPVQLTGGEDKTTIVAVTPDGKTLVVQRDRKGEENPGIYLLSAEGGALRPVQHVPGVQSLAAFVSRDGRWLYYAANDQRPDAYAVYRHELATGTKERLVDDPALWTPVDARDDGTLLLEKATGALTREYWERPAAGGALRPLLGQGEKVEYAARYGAAPGELLVVTNKLGDLRRPYRARGGALEPVSPELRWDVSSFEVDEARTRVLYAVNEAGYTRLHALDARTLRPVKLPAFPGAVHVFAGALTRSGRFVTLGVETAKAPRTSVVLDLSTGKHVRWVLPSAPEVDTARFSAATLEAYPARDGTPIPVFVRRPERCAADPCPVVVMFHGGPEGQALPGFSPGAQLYVDEGFVLVEPNVRGSDGYGKAWLAADDAARRLDVITDIEDAARWARKAFARDGREPKVAVTGGSYGGYSALIGMTLFAGAFDAGVSVVGIANLLTFLENTAPYRRILRASEYGDPAKDRGLLQKLSPTTYVDRVKGPLLVLQGASDPRVPVGEAVLVHDALAARGLAVELVIYPDEGHGAAKRENRVHMKGKELLFLRQHLLGGEAAAR